jgi:sulfate-transporting ATPase
MGYAVIGGLGYVAGPFVASPLPQGGVASPLLDVLGSGVVAYLPLLGGLGLLLTLLTNPSGLMKTFSNMSSPLSRVSERVRPPSRRTSRTSHPDSALTSEISAERPGNVQVRPATLSVIDLRVTYGGVAAVDDVSFALKPGRVLGLIGPNGAGKTSIIDAVTGLTRASAGRIELDGVDVTSWSTHRRARAGISRSFQSLELFDGISTEENVQCAAESRSWLTYVSALTPVRTKPLPPIARLALREFELEGQLKRMPSDMSYGQRRLLSIVRAVATGPSVLLLDEPAAGLDERETAEMADLVRRLALRWGIAILLVEHDMNFVMGVCDEIVVVEFGRQIASGTPDEVSADPAVIAAYLGGPADQPTNPDVVVPQLVVAPTGTEGDVP